MLRDRQISAGSILGSVIAKWNTNGYELLVGVLEMLIGEELDAAG